jgi:hypothetical protein
MELKLFIGNTLIESIPITGELLGYYETVRFLSRELLQRHSFLLEQTNEPFFIFIENVPSKLNKIEEDGCY